MSSLRKQEMGHCDPWRRQDLYSKQISSLHTTASWCLKPTSIILPSSPKCWYYKHRPPAWSFFLEIW